MAAPSADIFSKKITLCTMNNLRSDLMHDMLTKIAYPHPTFQNMPLDIETEWIIHVETVQTPNC